MNDSSLPKMNYRGKKRSKSLSIPEDMLKDLKRLADHYNLNDTQVIVYVLDKQVPKELEIMQSKEENEDL